MENVLFPSDMEQLTIKEDDREARLWEIWEEDRWMRQRSDGAGAEGLMDLSWGGAR